MILKSRKIQKFRVYYENKEEFDAIYKEIFVDKEYKFNSTSNSPVILDCGSHIGLSIIYFKLAYPNSKILGFEPNPENFKILQKNVFENKLVDVQIVNAAVGEKSGRINLYHYKYTGLQWTWGDTIVYNQWGDAEKETSKEVKTVKLSKYINNKVDLIKLDIEGSEQQVISEISSKLDYINEIVLEYHGTKYNQLANRLDIIISTLQKNFPKVIIKSLDVSKKFEKSDIKRANPTVINIHAFK